METHHLFLKKDGGKDEYQNLVLIHKHCLDPLHGNSRVFLELLLTLNREALSDVKISRTVLKTSHLWRLMWLSLTVVKDIIASARLTGYNLCDSRC
jgi:hypothetical protein